MAGTPGPSDAELNLLLENTLKTLDSLGKLRINPTKVTVEQGAHVFAGGFGDVQAATMRTSVFRPGIRVARKSLRLTGDRAQLIRVIAAFARELRVWSKISHPNILSMNGFYFDAKNLKTAWLTAPWQSNGNVWDYVRSNELDQHQRLKLALDTARGLAYLHRLSPPVYHGDIKPENAVIDANGDVKLCDFGLSKILEECPSGLTITQTPGYTVRYASPELFSDTPRHNLPSDVWAWGCLLLAISANLPPYTAYKLDHRIIMAIVNHELPAEISSLSVARVIKCLLHLCWKIDQEARPDMETCTRLLDPELPIFQRPPNEVPADLTLIRNDGWYAIHNPLLENIYSVEHALDFQANGLVNGFTFSPEGSSLVVLKGSTIIFYSATTGKEEFTMDLGAFYPVSIMYDVTGNRLAAASLQDGIRIIDCGTAQTDARFGPENNETCLTISFAHSDLYLVASVPGGLRVHSLDDDGRYNSRFQCIQSTIPISDVVTSPCHSLVVAISSHFKTGIVYDVATCSRGPRFKHVSVTAAAFTPDGKSLITGGSESGLRIWDLRPALGRQLTTLQSLLFEHLHGPQSDLSSISIASDGVIAASSSPKDKSLYLWDLAERRPLMVIGGDKLGGIACVRFQPQANGRNGTIAVKIQQPGQEPDCLRLFQYERQP